MFSTVVIKCITDVCLVLIFFGYVLCIFNLKKLRSLVHVLDTQLLIYSAKYIQPHRSTSLKEPVLSHDTFFPFIYFIINISLLGIYFK